MCFPQKEYKWKSDVIRESYINLGINLFEFLYFPKLNEKKIEQFVSFRNEVLVDEALSKANESKEKKGVFFLSGHISNWELTAFAYSLMFHRRLNIIAKIQSNEKVNNKINFYRELSGNEIIEISSSLRTIYSKIKNNEIVCFLVDQSANPDYSVYVDFFRKKVATFDGPAKMALKFGVELVLGYGIRTKDFNYEINFKKINFEDIKEYNDDNIEKLTQRIQKSIENVITQHPGQWLWFHRRFKHIKN